MTSALYKRRKELRGELSLIEKQIYDLETTYLEETKDFGNIFIGWSTYLSKEKPKARPKISNADRLFSLSSVTSPASRREDAKADAGVAGSGNGILNENSTGDKSKASNKDKKKRKLEDS